MNVKKTGKPIAAGILNIVIGVLGILGATTAISEIPSISYLVILAVFAKIYCIFLLLFSVLALVGGIFGVQRKHWGWALAGSIAAILPFLPLGIATTVLTAMSKEEFE
jgi:uncharacterized membrane protein